MPSKIKVDKVSDIVKAEYQKEGNEYFLSCKIENTHARALFEEFHKDFFKSEMFIEFCNEFGCEDLEGLKKLLNKNGFVTVDLLKVRWKI